FTGMPFVFAFWAVRQEAASAHLTLIFQHSRDRGLQPSSLDAICREWAPRTGISEAEVRSYLTENLCYELTAANLAGLEMFWKFAADEGILPELRPLRFAASPAGLEAARSPQQT
ncbi:MAG: hypothetical protein JO041_02200, partial [Acidobacteria bacterium]|nr:hypothetical protein [Acidobacteriota bacterium]